MDAVLLFSSQHGFWSKERGWVQDISEAEFLPSESSVVVRFKSTQDVNTVRLSRCKNYMPYDFFSMADKMMRLPQHKKTKNLLKRKLSLLTKERGRPLTMDEKIGAYTNVLKTKTDCHAIVGKNGMVTLFNKGDCKPADKAPAVGPFIQRKRHTPSRQKSKGVAVSRN